MDVNTNMNAELKNTSPADGLAPVYAQYPIEVVGAEGVWLHTRDGRKVLDLYGGHAVASLGYGHKGWTKALSDQAAQMNFQTNAVPMEIRARAAQKLLKFSKLPFDSVFWINSGAEANENAFKMAFKMRPGRTHVAAVEQSFHGRTAACASTTWQAPQKWFFLPRAPFDVSLDQAPRRRGHRQSRHGEHRGGHRRARAGRGWRIRHGPGIPGRAAQALRRNRRAADLRRSAMRRRPHRPAVRG